MTENGERRTERFGILPKARTELGEGPLDWKSTARHLERMTATAFLDLKQRAAKLTEQERRQLSAYLIKLGQERPAWKRETSKRLDAMAKGASVSVTALRKQLGHG